DLETVEGRVAALRAAAPVVAGIRDRSLGIGYVRNLAGWLGMDPDEVGRAVRSAGSRAPAATAESAQESSEPPAVRLLDLPTDPETRLARDALMVMLQRPAAVGPELMERATRVRLRNTILDVIRDGMASSLDAVEGPDWIARVTEAVPSTFAALVSQLGVAPLPETREANLDRYCRAQVADLVVM